MPLEGVQYPVNLTLAGRRCLVVGAGAVAARKIEGLLACGAEVTVVAPSVSAEVSKLGVAVQERPYRRGDVDGYRLVITATDDAAVNRAVYEDGETAGIWVNSADDPVSCAFTLPAVVRQGPIMVTVSTGGHSPALATWLKSHVAAELGAEYSVLVEMLSTERTRVKAEGGSTDSIDWRSALDSDMLELIRAGRIAQARERLQACLTSLSD